MSAGLIARMRGGAKYLSSDGGTTASGTTVAVNKPAGVASGMVLIGAAASDKSTGTSFTGDTGWSEKLDNSSSGGGFGVTLRIATLTAGGSEPSSYTFTAADSSNLTAQILAAVRGAYDTIGTAGTGIAGTLTAPGITMSASGLLVAAVVAGSISSDDGMVLALSNGGSGTPLLKLFYQYVAAGATGNRTFTVTGNKSLGVLIGIKRG